MLQNFLRIIQREPPKHRQPAIQPNTFTPHQGAHGGGGEDERGEARDGDEGDAREEGTAEVEVFFLFGGRADEGEGAHHGDCVEAGAGEEGGLEEEEGGEDGGLGDVETGPESVFLHVARKIEMISFLSIFRNQLVFFFFFGSSSCAGGWRGVVGILLIGRSVEGPIHCAQAGNKTAPHNNPGIRSHQSITPSTPMHRRGRHADNTNPQTGMSKGLIQKRTLVGRHAAIFSRFAVEEQVRCNDGATYDSATVKKTLAEGPARCWVRDALV